MNPDAARTAAEESAALYLAGALPPDEAAAAEARLATDAALAAAVAGFAAAAERLAAAGPIAQPPPAARDRLLAHIKPRRPTLPPGMMLVRAEGADWHERRPGVHYRFLNVDHQRRRFTALVRMAAGRTYRAHRHDDVEECLVLEGELEVGGVVMRAGDYQRAEPGSRHPEQRALTDCVLLLSASMDEPGE
jgi:anti-sigma factor ChrR (cupin superfamily)